MHIQEYTIGELRADADLERLLYERFTHTEEETGSHMRDFLNGIMGRNNLIPLYAGWALILVGRGGQDNQVLGWLAAYAPMSRPESADLNVFVDPDQRRRGIGQQLVQYAVAMCGRRQIRMENNDFFRHALPESYAPGDLLHRYVDTRE